MGKSQVSTCRLGAVRPGLIILFGFVVAVAVGGILYFYQNIPAGKPAQRAAGPEGAPATAGAQLYSNYCAACHGDKGDGNGPAARFLYPKPRDFREVKFRIVSTVNRLPADSDLLRVITNGMPGSAMFPFSHLSESDRLELVSHVRKLTRDGLADRLRQKAREANEAIDEAELAEDVDRMTRPGDKVVPPADWPAAEGESLARGTKAYLHTCAPCHGTTGKGDGAQAQFDDSGVPIRPRDFTRGIFKSGREKDQLYARVMNGMPGTPMPGLPNTPPADIVDLVNHVLSLSASGKQELFEQRRVRLLAPRAPRPLADDITEETWQLAAPARVVVSPLWWRAYLPPDLHVQAVHDGQSLALRLTWHDETHNASAVRPQDFQDMVAVQLFKGSPEPFLGMGTSDRSVDVWLWQPGGQAKPGLRADVDTAYPNMAVDFYPFEKSTSGSRAHAPENQPKEFITAWAAGNLRSDPTQTLTPGNLQSKGFGSLTMRPRVSQVMSAQGTWKAGNWTVILRRPLQVDNEAGVTLAAGEQVSIGFAIWDGAAGDRNGQKLVSVWHDLKLE